MGFKSLVKLVVGTAVVMLWFGLHLVGCTVRGDGRAAGGRLGYSAPATTADSTGRAGEAWASGAAKVLPPGEAAGGSVDLPAVAPGVVAEASASSRRGASPPRRDAEHGQLTAGDWDDNANFPFFLSYVDRFLASARGYPSLAVSDRAIIQVHNGKGQPVAGARVSVSAEGRKLFTGITAADGRVHFVPALDGAVEAKGLVLEVEPPADQPRVAAVTRPVPTGGPEWRVELPRAEARRPRALDLAFVVDTTGSMGDEIDYLKAEIQGIVDAVTRLHPDVQIRFGLVVYRDQGDAYVTRRLDFTGLQSFRTYLDAQHADGGGDTPEAMDEAMAVMNELSWRDGNVARVAFLVADAPTHPGRATRFLQQADLARKRGIRVYSVAASDTDGQAELLMRQASQLTLARYLFLTDDSGIGNPHAEPHIPCYQVQRLSDLLARTVRSELTGTREQARDVIRTVGNPKDGVCQGQNGVAYRL